MKSIEEQAVILYALENCEIKPFPGHPGGRNRILICCRNGEKRNIYSAYRNWATGPERITWQKRNSSTTWPGTGRRWRM